MLKFKHRKIRENEEGIVEVDGVKLDAANSEIVFADDEKDIQVVVSPDPENENAVTVAVLTNSEEDVESEKVLGSASVEGSEEAPDAEEARKAARREAFRKRLEARKAAKGTDEKKTAEERREAFRKRMEARKAEREANKKAESRQKAIAEARAKFRSKLGKKA